MLLQLEEHNIIRAHRTTAPGLRSDISRFNLDEVVRQLNLSGSSLTSTTARIRAAWEITRLLARSSSRSSRAYLAALGAIPPLVSMLHSTTSSPHQLQLEAQEAALLALLNLAGGNEKYASWPISFRMLQTNP